MHHAVREAGCKVSLARHMPSFIARHIHLSTSRIPKHELDGANGHGRSGERAEAKMNNA
jgi:hypothetical protein